MLAGLQASNHGLSFVSHVGGGVRLVTEIGVILQSERKFAVSEVFCRYNPMVEPLEEVSEGEKTLVEGKHQFIVYSRRCGGGRPGTRLASEL